MNVTLIFFVIIISAALNKSNVSCAMYKIYKKYLAISSMLVRLCTDVPSTGSMNRRKLQISDCASLSHTGDNSEAETSGISNLDSLRASLRLFLPHI